MAANDAVQRLQAAGWPVDKMPESARQVLTDLSAQEVDTMISVREKLMNAGGGDVQAYRAADNGIFYY